MRTLSILLALVALLFATHCKADTNFVEFHHRYTIAVGGDTFGFVDGYIHGDQRDGPFSRMFLGPLGVLELPFSATVGLVGVICFILLTLTTGLALLATRWKRPKAN